MSSLPVSNAPLVRLLTIVLVLGPALASVAHGQVNFSTAPTYGGAGTVFLADFNGDGNPDMLTADGTLNLGNGDGTFTAGTAVTGKPLAVADFNGDGKPDVLEQGTGTLLVLLGNGDGTFQPPISTNSGASLTAVAAVDLNGDGRADVAGVSNSTLLVYISKGDGTFATRVAYTLGTLQSSPTLMVFGDFDGDLKTDVAVLTDYAPGQDIVLLGNGDGTFRLPFLTSAGVAAPVSAVVGDFNGDGKLDLASEEGGAIFLQLGNGDGTFQAPTTACAVSSSGVEALGAADLNGDGRLDLVLAADLIGICLGNGDGTFSNLPNYYQPMSAGSAGIAIADFNLDGKPDVAADGEILLGNGNGRFQGSPAVPVGSLAAVVGKFVKNGSPGVALIESGGLLSSGLCILTNDGTGTLTLAHSYTLQELSAGIATADVNGDGNLDLIVTGGAWDTLVWHYSVLLGNGDGSFQSPVFYQQNSLGGAANLVIADFNNDGKPDLAISIVEHSDVTLAVLLGNGDGTFGSPVYLPGSGSEAFVTADFNGDGNLDIAWLSQELAILLGNGDGSFQTAKFSYQNILGSLLTAKLNEVGKADLISNSNGILTLLGNGDATFNVLPPFGSQGSIPVALADVNGDGNLDVITQEVVGSTVGNGIFLGNGGGTFDPAEVRVPYNYPPHSSFRGLQVADMNGDGKPDLIIESPVSSVFVLLNSTVPVPGTKFSPASVTFPSQTVGTSSNPTPVALTNTGAVTLTVKSVMFGGADAGEFKQNNNCATVEPLMNCTINVTFAPTATGGSSANLIVTDNAGTGSQQLLVSGAGASFAISAATPSPATVSAGGAATTTVTITSIGGFNQSVALACGSITLNGAAATTDPPTCAFSPPSVNNASGTSTLTVSTTGRMAAQNPVSTGAHGLFYAMGLPILGVALMGTGFRASQRKLLGMLLVVLMISGLVFLVACGGGSVTGGGGGGGTPAGTYTISISGSAGSMVNTTQVMLTVQ